MSRKYMVTSKLRPGPAACGFDVLIEPPLPRELLHDLKLSIKLVPESFVGDVRHGSAVVVPDRKGKTVVQITNKEPRQECLKERTTHDVKLAASSTLAVVDILRSLGALVKD